MAAGRSLNENELLLALLLLAIVASAGHARTSGQHQRGTAAAAHATGRALLLA